MKKSLFDGEPEGKRVPAPQATTHTFKKISPDTADSFRAGHTSGDIHANPGYPSSDYGDAYTLGVYARKNAINGEVSKHRGYRWSIGERHFKIDGTDVQETSAPLKKGLAGNMFRPGLTYDRVKRVGKDGAEKLVPHWRKLGEGEQETTEHHRTPPATLHAALTRQGAVFNGYDQHGTASYWHHDPKAVVGITKKYLTEQHGSQAISRYKSRLVSGENPSNVEHTLSFRHGQDEPIHTVRVTNVTKNRAESMPQRNPAPRMDHNKAGQRMDDAYDAVFHHANQAAEALHQDKPHGFVRHAAAYFHGSNQEGSPANLAYHFGSRARKFGGAVLHSMRPGDKPFTRTKVVNAEMFG